MDKGTILIPGSRLTTDEIFELEKLLYKAGYTRLETVKTKSDGKAYAVGIIYQREDQKEGKP